MQLLVMVVLVLHHQLVELLQPTLVVEVQDVPDHLALAVLVELVVVGRENQVLVLEQQERPIQVEEVVEQVEILERQVQVAQE